MQICHGHKSAPVLHFTSFSCHIKAFHSIYLNSVCCYDFSKSPPSLGALHVLCFHCFDHHRKSLYSVLFRCFYWFRFMVHHASNGVWRFYICLYKQNIFPQNAKYGWVCIFQCFHVTEECVSQLVIFRYTVGVSVIHKVLFEIKSYQDTVQHPKGHSADSTHSGVLLTCFSSNNKSHAERQKISETDNANSVCNMLFIEKKSKIPRGQ